MSSSSLMLSPWIIRTLTLSPLLASLVPRNFCRYYTPTIYLPQNSHHTYLLWHFHSHSEIYCHATFHHSVYYDTLYHCHIALYDHVVDIVFVAKPQVIVISYMSLLIHCTSRYTAGGIHCRISGSGKTLKVQTLGCTRRFPPTESRSQPRRDP